ncbi:outer row dynein assembly protein [Ectocarpus siliculosus]|uniref:Outer row dynein assembly protein n=1 Tax=Ectocarpus siliculosus TaxID=2880 RepID=D7FN44_ECTSI|nr:outer row dynein assembly protein [Ectocarpus siliculosus]|eukprot:CBJ30105.1 outer row dynein assembly protein [Ectocarpus siliculosus]
MDLTKAVLKKICRDSGLYSSPSLNDKLYLHYKGIRQIQNLEEYTGLRVLWLEGNGLSKLEGMEAQTQMKTLYAHENLIEKIEGLDSFLETLDVQHNRINDPDVVDIVSAMHDLRVLYLQGNPVVKSIRHYRKTLVSKCATLKYLDDRPVFDDERCRCAAWSKGMAEGGISRAQEAEREEMAKIRESKRAAEQRQYLAFEQMMREGLEAKKQAKPQHESLSENAEESEASGQPEPPVVNDSSQVSISTVQEGQESPLCDTSNEHCEVGNTGSSIGGDGTSGQQETLPLPPLPPPQNVVLGAIVQMNPRGQQKSMVSNTMEERNTRVPRLVNEFSGEDIIPFTDCETVRNARQSRAARILAPSTSTHRAPSSDATDSPEGSGIRRSPGLDHVEPLDDDVFDLTKLSNDVDEEIRAFEAESQRLREERILQNTPPPPPATVKKQEVVEVGCDGNVEVTYQEHVAEFCQEQATNFEELD